VTAWADTNLSTVTADQKARSTFARLVFTFTGTAIALTIEAASNYAVEANGPEIGVYVDGVFNQSFLVGNTSGQKRRMTATISGLSNTTHTVEVHEGGQQQSGALANPKLRGTWLLSLAASVAITPVAYTPPARRVLIYGDSISIGLFTSIPTQVAAIEQLRTAGYHVTSWGHGSRALFDDVTDAASASTFTAHLSRMLDGTSRNDLWIQIGFNDFFGTGGGGFQSASNFGRGHGAAPQRGPRVARPDVNIYLEKPILWGSRGTTTRSSTPWQTIAQRAPLLPRGART
jgi:hypothetical protein